MIHLLASIYAFPNVGIVGAHGGLGRELVYQCLEKSWNPIAIVRREKPIYAPVREGWLEEESRNELKPLSVPIVVNPQTCPSECDALIFAMSGSPFRSVDDSTTTVERLCRSMPVRCRRVCLVSAHGVGDSIENANIGIQLMRSWYLKSTYEEKEKQEEYVRTQLPEWTEPPLILRPKVLSFASIPFNPISTPRREIAERILDWVEE